MDKCPWDRLFWKLLGFYDGPIGNRITTTDDLTTTAIRRAIHAAWIDYTAQYDSRIITVHPQPSHVPPPGEAFLHRADCQLAAETSRNLATNTS